MANSIHPLLVSLLSSIFIANIVVGQLNPITQKAIDDVIQDEYFLKGRTPAVGLAIAKDGEVLYTKGYGSRDVENGIPADTSTLFYIGSISKSFTATMAVKVLSETFPELGEAVLDTPIRTLVPSFNFMLSDRFRSEQTTFRDLLSHRVVLASQDLNLDLGTTSDATELVYRQRYASEVYPFRTNYIYNNGHFGTVGELLAKLTGISYLQLLEEFLIDLGMTNTTYCKESDDHHNMPDRAVGYYWKDGKFNRFNSEYYKIVLPMVAAGGILSNVNDMAKYLKFHLNSGRVGDKQVIPEDVMKWLYKNTNPLGAPIPNFKTGAGQKEFLDVGYGLGLTLSSYDGWQIYEHGGYLPPFLSHLAAFPAYNISVFVTASATGLYNDYWPDRKLVYLSIFEILTGGSTQNVRRISPATFAEEIDRAQFSYFSSSLCSRKRQEIESSLNAIPNFQANDIVGQYGNGLIGQLEIIEKENSTGQLQPYMTLGKWGTGFLTQLSDTEYKFAIDSDYLHSAYAYGSFEGVEVAVTYDGADSLAIIVSEQAPKLVFIRNQTLDDLPVRPWGANTCGPIEL